MRIALISSKGGTGKTVTAVALACHWAHRHPTLLTDCDPQDVGSATWWLNRTDDKLTSLSWIKTTPKEVTRTINRVVSEIIVIDTRPSIQGNDQINLAKTVDLVLIPGSAYEAGTIIQTAKTINEACPTPCAAVLTKTSTQSTRAAITHEMTHVLTNQGCPVIGQIRRYTAMEAAPLQGRRPGQLAGQPGLSLKNDITSLAHNIETRTKPQ